MSQDGAPILELLAPAGTEEAACAALANGADAVYLGLEEFNARRNADNLTIEALGRVCRLAHLGGQRVYLAMNTALLEGEVARALDLVDAAWGVGIDAVIVQDLGFLAALREHMPWVDVHASTQMNVHDAHGVALLRDLGATRVTLARELSLEELVPLTALGVEIEVFGHGALCVCYSGQCLMSSLIGRRSANRGLCAQACRLPWTLADGAGDAAVDPEEVGRYLLSPHDLATIGIIPDLLEIGIASLKIEGRMKSPEYVAIVTGTYRAVLDRALAARDAATIASTADVPTSTPTDEELDSLAEAFSRGFTTGYLQGERGNALMGYKRPNNRGVRVGRVSALGDGLVTLSIERGIAVGDTLEYWTSRGTIVEEVTSLMLDGEQVDAVLAGASPQLVVHRPVAPSDRVFRVRNGRLSARARDSFEGFVGRTHPVVAEVTLLVGQPLRIAFTDEQGNRGEALGPLVEPARTKPVREEDVRVHVGRLGGTPYEVISWSLDVDSAAGVGFSQLHHVRRDALAALEERILESWSSRVTPYVPSAVLPVGTSPCVSRRDAPTLSPRSAESVPLPRIAVLGNRGNASAIAEEVAHLDGAYLELPAVDLAFEDAGATRPDADCIFLPNICHDGGDKRVLDLVGPGVRVVADNLSLLDECVRRGAVVEAGPHIPIWNREAVALVDSLGARRIWLSPELSLAQVRELAAISSLPLGLTVTGAQELMVTEHCELMSMGPCTHDCPTCPRRSEHRYLIDRKDYRFPVRTDAVGRGHVYNSAPLDVLFALPDLIVAGISAIRIDATLLDGEQARAVLHRALRARESTRTGHASGDAIDKVPGATTGHLFRGVL